MNEMVNVIAMRHGEPAGGEVVSPLSDAGREGVLRAAQIHILGNMLGLHPIDVQRELVGIEWSEKEVEPSYERKQELHKVADAKIISAADELLTNAEFVNKHRFAVISSAVQRCLDTTEVVEEYLAPVLHRLEPDSDIAVSEYLTEGHIGDARSPADAVSMALQSLEIPIGEQDLEEVTDLVIVGHEPFVKGWWNMAYGQYISSLSYATVAPLQIPRGEILVAA